MDRRQTVARCLAVTCVGLTAGVAIDQLRTPKASGESPMEAPAAVAVIPNATTTDAPPAEPIVVETIAFVDQIVIVPFGGPPVAITTSTTLDDSPAEPEP